MTQNEIARVLSTLKAAYPSSYRDMTNADVDALVKLWKRQFEEYRYDEVIRAVDSIISTSTSDFAPSVGKIKDMIIKLRGMSHGQALTEQEAWNFVNKALYNSIYKAGEEFDKLPEEVKAIVGSPRQLREWAMMNSDTVDSVVASNFMRSYRARINSVREYMALPHEVKEMLSLTMKDIKKIE